MDRNELAGAVLSYFATQWAGGSHSAVQLVTDNRKAPTQQPDPTNPEASSWIKAFIGDIDGPRLYTYGGTLYSGGYLFFQVYTPIDVGSGYADELLDDAIAIVRGVTTGGVEFLPAAETFFGYKEESGYWWQVLGRVPFRVLDD